MKLVTVDFSGPSALVKQAELELRRFWSPSFAPVSDSPSVFPALCVWLEQKDRIIAIYRHCVVCLLF